MWLVGGRGFYHQSIGNDLYSSISSLDHSFITSTLLFCSTKLRCSCILWCCSRGFLSSLTRCCFVVIQDVNPVICSIILSQQCPRLLVGDPHQQIYNFMGSFNMLDSLPASRTLALTHSFRLGDDVADLCNRILRGRERCKSIIPANLRPGAGKIAIGEPGKHEHYTYIARSNLAVFSRRMSAVYPER